MVPPCGGAFQRAASVCSLFGRHCALLHAQRSRKALGYTTGNKTDRPWPQGADLQTLKKRKSPLNPVNRDNHYQHLRCISFPSFSSHAHAHTHTLFLLPFLILPYILVCRMHLSPLDRELLEGTDKVSLAFYPCYLTQPLAPGAPLSVSARRATRQVCLALECSTSRF